MIRYKTHPDNNNYILIGIRTNISMLLYSYNIPPKIEEQLEEIYYGSLKYLNNSDFTGDIAIRKDSLLGEYILTEYDYGNEDLNITHEKIRNALDIAMFEEDEISSLIFPLFKNLEGGRIDKLKEKYDENILDYIAKRNDFKLYIDKLTGTYQGRVDLIYDNGLIKKNLYEESKKENKQKKK